MPGRGQQLGGVVGRQAELGGEGVAVLGLELGQVAGEVVEQLLALGVADAGPVEGGGHGVDVGVGGPGDLRGGGQGGHAASRWSMRRSRVSAKPFHCSVIDLSSSRPRSLSP